MSRIRAQGRGSSAASRRHTAAGAAEHRHTGQLGFTLSHLSTHAAWKRCLHGATRLHGHAFSASSPSCRQAGQQSSSGAMAASSAAIAAAGGACREGVLLVIAEHDHEVIVVTSYPLGDIVHNHDTMEWISKWALELMGHDIRYIPRTAIKS